MAEVLAAVECCCDSPLVAQCRAAIAIVQRTLDLYG